MLGPSVVAVRLTPRQRIDFRVGREAAECLLGKFELAVDEDLEDAPARTDELDINLGQLLQACPRTEGFWLVASTAAIVNRNVHFALLARQG